jgi:hypothetical protein
MLLCGLRRFFTLEHFFDQINTATRAIEFITQNLIGWTGSTTKPTVNAAPQDGIGLFTKI